jgi:phosphoglucosamine mutase
MRTHGFNVGGEQSGHIVLKDFGTTGDGLVAALQVLAALKAENKPVSQLCHLFDPLPQLLKNVRFKKGEPLNEKDVKEAISEGEARLGKGGRLVIRKSGTEPLIRVMGEGDDEKLVRSVVKDICMAIEGHAA